MDSFLTIALPPGLFKNGTRAQARDRWYDANLVRFFEKTIRPVGAWRRLRDFSGAPFAQLVGVPRAATTWRTSGNGVTQVIATEEKLYAIEAGTRFDITPTAYLPPGVAPTMAPGTYGVGAYGMGVFNEGRQDTTGASGGNWQLAPFGNALACVSMSDQRLWVWDGETSHLAAAPLGAPSSARGVVATPERFLFVLGAKRIEGGFEPNVRSVAWPKQEATGNFLDGDGNVVDVWAPGELSTAGDFELATNGVLVCGAPSRGATLLWTDSDLHTATWIGGVFVYRFARVGENCGIVSPHAFAMLDGAALWMGRNGFFRYDGYVKELPCEVQDYVFGDITPDRRDKIWAAVNSQFGEVWWYYPSKNAEEIDRYVVYNYREEHWTVGELSRTAGYDAGAVRNPVWADAAGFLYEHELPADSESAEPLPSTPFVESGPLQMGEGDRLVRIQRVVPDAKTLADVNLSVYTAFDPTSPESMHGPFQLDQPTWTQILARQIRLRIDQVTRKDWRVGNMKLGIKESSRR